MSLIFRSIYVSQREFKNTIQRRKERYKSFTQLDKFRCRKTPGITVRTLLQIRRANKTSMPKMCRKI